MGWVLGAGGLCYRGLCSVGAQRSWGIGWDVPLEGEDPGEV